jgi:N-acetylneuraminic acid mutarotase
MSIGLAAALTAGACGDDGGGSDDGAPGDDGGPRPDAGGLGDGAPGIDASPGQPSWGTLNELPFPVQETAVVALDDRIYVLGGIDVSLATRADVHRFEQKFAGEWTESLSLPLPVHHMNAAVVDGRIYVVGSLLAGFDPIGDVWSWAPGDQEWSVGASMPPGSERGAAAVGVVDGRIVVAGGLDGTSSDLVSAYDPIADEWDVDLPDLPARIDHGTGQVVDGTFYVIGGRTDGIGESSSAVWALVDGAWEERAPMPTARGGIASGVLDGKIAVVGGEGNDDDPSGVFPQTELYDPATDEWTALPDMPTPRHGMGAAAVDGALYVPGGATRETFGAVDDFEVLRLP